MTDLVMLPQPEELEITPVRQSSTRGLSILDMSEAVYLRIDRLAELYALSSFNSSKNPKSKADYMLIMLKGLELSIKPMSAVDLISIINGKPVLDAKGMLALVKDSGLLEAIKIDSTDEYCRVTMTRKGEAPHTEEFSLADARKFKTMEYGKTISLSEKANWVSQPRTMLKWRAVTAGCRAVFPDIIGGLYTHEEMDTDAVVHEDGSMTISTPSPKQLPANTTPLTPWHEDKAKIAAIVNMAIEKGYGDDEASLLKLLGKQWADFETGKQAFLAIEAEHNILAEALQTPSIWSKNAEAILGDMLKFHFNRPFSDIFTLPETDFNHDLSVYSTANSAWGKLIPAAIKAGWAVTSSHITHVAGKGEKNQGARLEFDTAIGKISIFSRQSFVKMVGEPFGKKFGIATMEPGELVIDPVLIEWETNKAGHRAIVSAKPVTPINEHIEQAIANVINGLDNDDEPSF